MTFSKVHFRRLRATAALLVPLCALSPAHAAAPVCADDEKLFELDFVGGGNPPFRVFTESSGVVHIERAGDINNDDLLVQLCLPANECHTAVVASEYRLFTNRELVARWGGEVLLESSSYYMERVDFGAGCVATCDPANEAEFEFFLPNLKNDMLPLTWKLTDVETQAALAQGEIVANRTELVFEKACVPSSSCLEFFLEYPQDGPDESMAHSLRLGGSIYSDGDLWLGPWGGSLGKPDSFNHTVYLGQCTPKAVCKTATEDLFEMEFTTEPVLNGSIFGPKTTAYFGADFPFYLSDIDNADKYYVWSASYKDFEGNRTYEATLCIPKDNCKKFHFGVDNQVVGYKIFQNGQELRQRYLLKNKGPYGDETVTDLGEWRECPLLASQVSSTGRGKAAVASVAALLLLGAVW